MKKGSKHWRKEDIISLLKMEKTNEEIFKIYPSISSATLATYRKKVVKEKALQEMELKIKYATKLVPDHLDLETYLKEQWEEFTKKSLAVIDKIDKILNERLDSGDISTKDLIIYKIQLLGVLKRG